MNAVLAVCGVPWLTTGARIAFALCYAVFGCFAALWLYEEYRPRRAWPSMLVGVAAWWLIFLVVALVVMYGTLRDAWTRHRASGAAA